MITRRLAAAAALALLAPVARADDADLRQAVEDLSARVEELEAAQNPARSRGAEWMPGIRISGNADLLYADGERNSLAPEGRFVADNARLFLDADLGWEAQLFGRTVMEAASFYVEWDIARYGILLNDIGSLYGRVDGILGTSWLNVKLGRMPIPYGEEYLRWYEERPRNPLFGFSVGSPYNWDEGVMLFGSGGNGRTGYFLALMEGDDGFGKNADSDPAIAGKLVYQPARWARLSFSGLHTGGLGSATQSARSAMKFGWTQAIPFGSGTSVPSFQNGLPVAPDPDQTLDSLDSWESDLVLERANLGRLWLSFGQIWIDSGGASSYDRSLLYGVAEAIFELGALTPLLAPFYVAARYSEIGTYDPDEGYLLIALNRGSNLGFNTRRVTALSAGSGMRVNDHLTLKAEYSWFTFELVDGVTAALEDAADDRNYFGVGLTLGF